MAKKPAAPKPTYETALAKVRKSHGKGAIFTMSDREILPMEFIPTGSLGLDIALGIGGWARGRIHEIFGPESSGKTTLGLLMLAEAQKAKRRATIIDMEHALDFQYSKDLGVNMGTLEISQPDTGEQALDIVEELCRGDHGGAILVDSVAGLVPEAELNGSGSGLGLHARMMSECLRKLNGLAARSNTTVLFINQIREKIGVMFGNPETTTGGRALKFYSTCRVDIRQIAKIKTSTDGFVGTRNRVKVVKNKVARPFKEAEFSIHFGKGVQRDEEVISIATGLRIVDMNGAWFSFCGERMGMGKDAAIEWLKKCPKVRAQIEEGIAAALKDGDPLPMNQPADEGTDEAE